MFSFPRSYSCCLFAVQYAANGHYYEVIATSVGWSSALSAAAMLPSFRGVSGHLATISSSNENSFVQSILDGVNAWVDGSKSGGYWVFSSGPEANANVSYGNWQSVLSNSGVCGVMRSTGQWDDISCASSNYFIVEYECAPGYAFNSTACYGLCMFCCCPS